MKMPIRGVGVCDRPGDRGSLAVVVGLCALKVLVHLALVNRYGYHGDELYFVECGRRLAFGYVDHAPLIPWIARIADELGDASLLGLRLPAIAAGGGTMVITALLVREWGGGRQAQTVAMLSILLSPAFLRMGAMLNIPVVEVFLCTTAAYLVARTLRRRDRWTWLSIGAVAGIALLAKHTALLWGVGLTLGLLVTEHRRALRHPGPWIALGVAALLFAPNLLWQIEHGFPTLEFGENLRRDILVEQGRALFALGQILYFHPLVLAVWIAGLFFAFTRAGRPARPFAVLFLVMFGALLAMGGRPYYMASAYPAVLAAGGVALERWLTERAWLWRSLTASIAAVGIALAGLTLPLLPIRMVDAAVGRVLGWLVPPMALTHDMHGELGWDAHVDAVNRVVESLSPEDRARASVLTRSYSQAAALNVLRLRPTPRAVSGHMNYYLWGPDDGRGSVLIAYGITRELLERHYSVVEERSRIVAPLARPSDTELPVHLCRTPRGEMSALWLELRRFDHGMRRRDPSAKLGAYPVDGSRARSLPEQVVDRSQDAIAE